MLGSLVLCAVLSGAPGASNQTLIFYNARLAGREKHPNEVLKLWLLHNSVAELLREPPVHEPDFLSSTWVALGDSGLCPDGLIDDEAGAGLWPLALRNWLVRNLTAQPPGDPMSPFDAFEVGKQQRLVSMQDTLSARELQTVSFFRTACWWPWNEMWDEVPGLPDLKDRIGVAKLMRQLLRRSRSTLAKDKVVQREVIEARIFDIDLLLTELKARQARRLARATQRRAKALGVAQATGEPAPLPYSPSSEEGKLLRGSLRWSTQAWLGLTPERRLFLFSKAKPFSDDAAGLARLQLSLLDANLARRSGDEVEQWVASFTAGNGAVARHQVFDGERGRRLLELDPTTGFRERAVISLHRGVGFLEVGALEESLRSFAYALAHAGESREEDALHSLSRRWLSYVLSRHETTDGLIATLRALVPRNDYNAVIEDLVWRAAFTADAKSFELCARSTRGNGALDQRIARLRPLASGKLTPFGTELRQALADESFSALRFVRQLLERLEAEGGDVRKAQAPTLALVAKLLSAVAANAESGGAAQQRTANELLGRAQAVLDGLADLGPDSQARLPRDLAPSNETFAGSIRLAPSDPLPWPFAVDDAPAPSAFTRLELVPMEWRDAKGELVMGWRIEE